MMIAKMRERNTLIFICIKLSMHQNASKISYDIINERLWTI